MYIDSIYTWKIYVFVLDMRYIVKGWLCVWLYFSVKWVMICLFFIKNFGFGYYIWNTKEPIGVDLFQRDSLSVPVFLSNGNLTVVKRLYTVPLLFPYL